jgi:DNA polymerase-3 subunit alpha
MVSCASDMGYKSLALTDHGTCAGLFQFQKTCKEKGIKPILGMEAYICSNHTVKDKDDKYYHLILLAKNAVGYNNLIYLSSFANVEGFYHKPRIDLNVLESHKDGLIVSTACCGGEIPMLIWSGKEVEAEALANKYKEIFKDDFYLEIMLHTYFNDKTQEAREKKLANALYKMGKRLNIKVIATQDSHYTRKDDWEAQNVLLAIQTHHTIKDPDRPMNFGSDDFYIKPFEQMKDLFSKAPDVLANTVEISEKIEGSVITTGQDLLPIFDLPIEFNSDENYLRALVQRGMEAKGLNVKQEYKDRIDMELEVITKCKYTRYFLILWDIVNFTRSANIRLGVGRGSAVSSLCLYVLDVTRIDPIKYDLIFERFLNPERISPPDVDLDFDYDRRDEVYEYIIRKYGADRCCQIGTYNKYKARAVIKNVAKALDIGKDWDIYLERKAKNPTGKIEETKNSLDLADTIAKQIPFKADMTIEVALKRSDDFRKSMHKYPKLLECARRVEGTVASAGVHPAGILLCKDPVIERIPLRNAKGVICSQYDGGEVEKLGLLKFDLLALKTLTVIDKTLKLIKERQPDSLPKGFDIDKLEPNDPKVFNMLNGLDETKNTLGVFQFEAQQISQLLAHIHVTDFEDMIVANALYRPGPLGAGMHDMYCDYKHGRKQIQYLHPKMGEALKDTYGIMIYQENIMRVAQKLAGFTGGQADSLRKAIGKKDKVLMEEAKKSFIEGCVKHSIDKEIAEKIFAQIEYFGGYGFNKCLSGDTKVLNKADGSKFTLKELEGIFSKSNSDWRYVDLPIVLDSYVDGEIVEDEVLDVFETGEKEIYEIELDNGMIIKCTLDHKFYCSDGKPHTVKEIMEKELEIIYE